MADAIPELWPEDGQVYPIPGNTMEANTFQYYSEDDPTSIQCQTIPGNTTQYSPALRAARTEQPAVAEMPTHPFVHPATRLKS